MEDNRMHQFETARRLEMGSHALTLLTTRIESNDAPPAKASDWSNRFEASKLKNIDALKSIFK